MRPIESTIHTINLHKGVLDMTKSLTGKVALVTGGSRGIGAATARALADVGITYVTSGEKAELGVQELKARGVRAAAFRVDQSDATQSENLIASVAKRFGRLDILVNNAGVFVTGMVDDPTSDLAEFDRQL